MDINKSFPRTYSSLEILLVMYRESVGSAYFLFKVFIELVTVLLLFYALVFCLQGMWDLISLTRDHPLHWKAKS